VINLSKTTTLEIYPNPAKDLINVQFSGKGAQTISLTDLSGRTIKEFAVQNTGNVLAVSIDISSLSKGIYLLKAGGESKKFIKE
jgi:hypothetical protein